MIHLVIALPSEAKPLIKGFKLSSMSNTPFRLYGNNAMRLIISGVGQIAAAAATAYLAATSPSRSNGWINIGIAGCGEMEIGTGLLAHKIIDNTTQQCWYPPLIHKSRVATATLLTTDKPLTHYQPLHVHEMEAAGFYATASRFSTAELIHCYKVISDNHENSIERISAKQVEKLIYNRLTEIDLLVKEASIFSELHREFHRDPELMESFLKRWHFTSYQKNQLRQLLLRWQAVVDENQTDLQKIWNRELKNQKNSKGVIKHLQQHLSGYFMKCPSPAVTTQPF